MSAKTEARALTIKDLLASGRFYRVPPYQRPYSWGETQVGDLIADLLAASSQPFAETAYGEYYLGTMVFVADGRALNVVDGQQRLATLGMLLGVLRDLEPDKSHADSLHSLLADEPRPFLDDTYRVRLELRPAERAAFGELVQARAGTARAEPVPQYLAQDRMALQAAIHQVREALQDIPLALRRRLSTYIVRSVVVFAVTMPSTEAAYRLFRTTNQRGMELSAADALKSDLFERAVFTPEEAQTAAEHWENMESSLGRTGFVTLLRNVRTIQESGPQAASSARAEGAPPVLLPGVDPRAFLTELLPRYCATYGLMRGARGQINEEAPEASRMLRLLSWLPQRGWQVPVLAFLQEHRIDSPHTLVFLQQVERLGYALALGVMRPEQRASRWRRVLEGLSDPDRLMGEDGPLALTTLERETVVRRLKRPFPDKEARRAFAFRINAELPGGEAIAADDGATVEHVLPVNPCEHWSKVAPTREELAELSNLLGNFALVSRQENEQADRLTFDEKRAIYRRAQGRARFALTRELDNYTTWDANVIRARTDRFGRLLRERWGVA